MDTLKDRQLAEPTIAANLSYRRLIRVAKAYTMSRAEAFEAYSIGRGNLGDGVDPFLLLPTNCQQKDRLLLRTLKYGSIANFLNCPQGDII